MTRPDLVLLCVDDPSASASFDAAPDCAIFAPRAP
jgi:hypothetical protein